MAPEPENAEPERANTGDHPDQGEMRERQTARRANRRRSGTPSVNTIYWRDIPAQLTARGGDESSKVLLHARFQHAIDRAAAAQGQSRTEFMLDSARKAAAEVLLDRRLFQLSESEFAAFEHQLDAPVGEGVAALLASKSPWEK